MLSKGHDVKRFGYWRDNKSLYLGPSFVEMMNIFPSAAFFQSSSF